MIKEINKEWKKNICWKQPQKDLQNRINVFIRALIQEDELGIAPVIDIVQSNGGIELMSNLKKMTAIINTIQSPSDIQAL